MAIVISGVNNNDKITASDGTIDLLSSANLTGILTAPAFSASGNITAASINVGNSIQLGNAGVATATTFVGNLTGNVNNTGNLLLQIGGSEKFRVASSGQLGIGGANYGSSGQVLTSGGSGSAATWSTISTPDADKIIEGNTKAEVIDSGSDGRFIVETEGTERLHIKSNGYMGVGNFSSKPTAITDPLNVDSGIGTCNIGGNYIHLRRYSGGNTQYINAPQNNANLHISADDFIAFGVDHSSSMYSMGKEALRIDSSGNVNISGILTATSVTQRQSKYYGVTTTERNALSPSEGDIVYNTTTNKHEFYTSSSAWASISATPPSFDNASGSLATFYSESRSTTTLSSQPTASGDAPITYSISAGSLPSGMSINTSTGVISGTPNAVGSDTTSNFTVQASNLGGAVTRDYSITVKAPVTTNYSYTGSTVNWSKPNANVKRVLFRMWGGAGTHGTCTSNSQHPGAGGKTEGVINVESHNNLYLQVGEAGKDTSSGPNGGWPNGGNGNISHQCKGSGGGGSSNIYHSSGTGSYTYIVAVAGGGGSVSHGNPNSNGGDGGGTNGGSSNRGGGGGTQNAGGAQGSTDCGNTGNSGAGTRLQGGTAGTGSGCTNAAAGGGGGWWGGGAGGNSNSGNTYGGGGGGSGYFDTSLVSSGATKSYGESGWSADQPSGIAARASYGDNNRGGHGYITLVY